MSWYSVISIECHQFNHIFMYFEDETNLCSLHFESIWPNGMHGIDYDVSCQLGNVPLDHPLLCMCKYDFCECFVWKNRSTRRTNRSHNACPSCGHRKLYTEYLTDDHLFARKMKKRKTFKFKTALNQMIPVKTVSHPYVSWWGGRFQACVKLFFHRLFHILFDWQLFWNITWKTVCFRSVSTIKIFI